MRQGAFLFPGQGSQRVGMGLDLFENSDLARRRYKQANAIMGIDIATLSFNGPEEKLRQTEYTQPAVFIVSAILAELLMERGHVPLFAAGHSLGEYSALTAAGVFSFKDALSLVKTRGKSMQESGSLNPGTMAAIIGLDAGEVRRLCEEASGEEVVKPANFNSQNQIVISGHVGAVRRALQLAKDREATRTMELNVSGAFHSPLMSLAKKALDEALESFELKKATFPVVMNVSAKPVTNPWEIRENLLNQIDHPVRWQETVQMLKELKVMELTEVGPGKVLTGLARRIDRSFSVSAVESLADVNNYNDVRN